MSDPIDFAVLDALKTEWDALQPLAADRERRLWKKLRLEWNYHSNHIEGNTLTYGETELLLLHGQAVGDHALRDYEEMKAHDVGIEHLRMLAADRARELTEGDIRDLNRIILKEAFWKPAQTADGQPTRKQIVPGQYKTAPNNVLTATGELFEFASLEDTAPRMQALVRWLSEALASGSLHPVALASKLHHDFVLIHPFDDGNGRVARMLVNYVLLRNGYSPIIVRSDDKPAYLTALRKADAGEGDALTDYLAVALRWSLNLGIRAAKGQSIEELSDVDKEVAIFIHTQRASKDNEMAPTRKTVADLMAVSLKPFLDNVETRLSKLAPLFRRWEIRVQDGIGSVYTSIKGVPDRPLQFVGPGQHILVSFMFYAYQGDAPTTFDHETVVGLHFPPAHYTITHGAKIISRPYTKPISGEEADALAAKILTDTFTMIKVEAGQKDR